MSRISHKQLKRYLKYDRSTGAWLWLRDPRTHVALPHPKQAGWVNSRGYRSLAIFGRTYRTNRLAVFYVTKKWPKKHVDHANGNNHDEVYENLRQASREQNISNSKLRTDSTTGYKGVYKHKNRDSLWSAKIKHQGKRIFLGYFSDPQLAHAAYCEAAVRLKNTFARFA